jgi:formylglycine-generating enzyme required for sulfatase activity
MGTNSGFSNEKPVHRVRIKTFWMAKSEVTVAQYRRCVRAGRCSKPRTGKHCNWGKGGRGQHPVNCVDWKQARSFSRWAGGRLPSEAQWEYAARSGGKSWKYPWGNAKASCARAVMPGSGGWGCGKKRTWPVCSKPRGNSRQGLCDLAGNVCEWVRDRWHGSYQGAPTDGSAWVSGSSSLRVLRGGS